jgi:hypothetical protein
MRAKEASLMKRIMLSALAGSALALTIPGAALANRGHEVVHHHRHHHHKVGLGATQLPTSANAAAATVVSLTNGVLTLKLTDGSTLSAAVTNATKIGCEPALVAPTAATADEHGNRGPGNAHNGDDQNGSGGGDRNDNADGNGNGNDVDNGDDRDNGEEPICDSTTLVAGAVVREAELRIVPSGTQFTSIELAR